MLNLKPILLKGNNSQQTIYKQFSVASLVQIAVWN